MAKLRVHNIEPSTGTDVAFGTSGDTVAVSSDSLKLNTWKDSGGNTLFVSDGAGTVSSVNSGFTGGGPQLILSQTASDSASVSFTANIDSTYDKYMFVFVNINPATEDYNWTFNGSIDGGSNYNVTKTTTTFTAYHAENNVEAALGYDASRDLAQSTAFGQLGWNLGSGADECAVGIFNLYAPSSTTYVKQFAAITQYMFSSNYSVETFVGGYFNTTDNIDAMQFKMSSGNFDGTIKMYGVS